jgi:alpha-tubulin suppressor-like RCC1 family protein
MNFKKGLALGTAVFLISSTITSSVSADTAAEMKDLMSQSFNLKRSDYRSDPEDLDFNFMPGGLIAQKVDHGQLGGIMLASGKGFTWGWNGWSQIGIGKDDGLLPGVGVAKEKISSKAFEYLSYSGGMVELTFFSDEAFRNELYAKYENKYGISEAEKFSGSVDLIDVDAGYHHFVALDENHNVWAWGKNTDYEVGRKGESKYSFPQRVNLSLDEGDYVVKVYGHNGYLDRGQSFAVTNRGQLWSWGSNSNGKHGTGASTLTADYQSTPHRVVFPGDNDDSNHDNDIVIKDVQGGDYHNVALDMNGNVYTWGLSTYLGTGDKTSTKLPKLLSGSTNAPWTENESENTSYDDVRIQEISVSYANSLLLDTNGDVWQFGGVYFGPSMGNLSVLKTPQKVEIEEHEKIRVAASYQGSDPEIVAIEAGESVSYMIDSKGRSWAWGDNRYSGMGREGAHIESRNLITNKAYQFPQIIGDGDTQLTHDTEPKFPVGKTQPEAPNPKSQNKTYGTYGFNTLHPTIYDQRYTDIPADHTAVPQELKAMAYWKESALTQIPRIKSIQASRSAYSIIDYKGNVFIWSYDGSASVAWGSDFDKSFDLTGNGRDGMFDKYLYEVTPFGASGSTFASVTEEEPEHRSKITVEEVYLGLNGEEEGVTSIDYENIPGTEYSIGINTSDLQFLVEGEENSFLYFFKPELSLDSVAPASIENGLLTMTFTDTDQKLRLFYQRESNKYAFKYNLIHVNYYVIDDQGYYQEAPDSTKVMAQELADVQTYTPLNLIDLLAKTRSDYSEISYIIDYGLVDQYNSRPPVHEHLNDYGQSEFTYTLTYARGENMQNLSSGNGEENNILHIVLAHDADHNGVADYIEQGFTTRPTN